MQLEDLRPQSTVRGVHPDLFRLVSEARRIRLGHLFDPHLAVHTSVMTSVNYELRDLLARAEVTR